MMVSDQHRQEAQPAAMDAAAAQQASAAGATPALDMSAMIPFPKLDDDAATAVAASSEMPGFAPLPFDESLISSSAASSSVLSSSVSTANNAMAAATGLPANFFVDTAALAQHLAAVVADEKKLSDNIMDLIPPPMPIATDATTSSGMGTSTTSTTAPAAAVTSEAIPMPDSLSTPLGPPADLMLRALSPPTSLLPELVHPPAMLLDTSSGSAIKTEDSTASDSTTASSSAVQSATTSSTATATALSQAALLKKRKSVEAFGEMKNERTTPGSTPVVSSATTPLSTVSSGLHQANNGSASVLNAAAAAAAAAREKVMKEPQSGDLYECVITKRNGGLGLTLACVDDHVQITGLAPDTPAANSGICVGDTLVAVSGLPVRGLQFSTVIGRLKSTTRNSVVLKLRRNPFRQNSSSNSSFRSLKRPARASTKTSESNSANVLTSKSLALETRLGGSVNGHHLHSATHGSNASSLLGMNGSSASASASSSSEGLHQLQVKSDPTNSTYFATDPSIFSMGSATVSMSAALANADLGWKVTNEEKDRYYAECRTLRTELAQAMNARRLQKRQLDDYTGQLQRVVDGFQRDMQALLSSPGSSGSSSSTNDDLVALRQKLLEVNHALARQQTEILELKERDARHALPESHRVKWQLLTLIRKKILGLDLKSGVAATASSSASESSPSSPFGSSSGSLTTRNGSTSDSKAQSGPLAFEERVEGIRPSVFELLFGQDVKVHATSAAATVELDLDAKACTQALGWNLRELVVQGAVPYVVSVAGCLHVKYLQPEEALAVSWKFGVRTLN